MTPIPHANTDDSDGTESEDEREIVSFCGQCNAQVPIQMKENGSCHGKSSDKAGDLNYLDI